MSEQYKEGDRVRLLLPDSHFNGAVGTVVEVKHNYRSSLTPYTYRVKVDLDEGTPWGDERLPRPIFEPSEMSELRASEAEKKEEKGEEGGRDGFEGVFEAEGGPR